VYLRGQPAIGDVQSLTDRGRCGNEFWQVFEFLEVTRDLFGMRQDIVSQQQDITLQFWQQNVQLFRSADAVGVKKYTVEGSGKSLHDLGRRTLLNSDCFAESGARNIEPSLLCLVGIALDC